MKINNEFDDKIIKNLPLDVNSNIGEVLRETFNGILGKLKSGLGTDYKVISDELVIPEKVWSHEIKVIKSSQIGAMLDLSWRNSSPSSLRIEVTKFSKLDSTITYIISLIFLAIGAYMGTNRIAPLDFLSGEEYKIAAGIGGLLAMIPGGIIIYIFKTIIIKKQRSISDQLVLHIKSLIG